LTFLDLLPYFEGEAYIAIVVAVLGVPQMLSSYFDIRERRRSRSEDRLETERTRSENRLEAERIRQEAERTRREAEQTRREERAEAERRHTEMMTALAGILAGQSNGRPAASNGAADNAELLRRLAAIEAALGISGGPTHDHSDG
jgi:Flp pilus assembly protein TadB